MDGTHRFYVGHVRGADFEQLRKLGFVVFHPTMDDYVFLEVAERNYSFLKRQSELGVSFLKSGSVYETVSREELESMANTTLDQIKVGSKIKVLQGFCENMEGEVKEVVGNKLKCVLKGYKREYEQSLLKTDVVILES